jgi:hypothetical protein
MGGDGVGGVVLILIFVPQFKVMKHKSILAFLLHFLSIYYVPNLMAQGLRSNTEAFSKLPLAKSEQLGFAAKLPARHSMRRYAPKPGMQEGSTCVGWSVAYSAMSIIYNKLLGITNDNLKTILAFDPIYTYALAQPASRTDCEAPTTFPEAFVQLLEYGAKRTIMPPGFMDCDESVFGRSADVSSAFTPSNVYQVTLEKAKNNTEKLLVIKQLLASNNPVTFGIDIYKSEDGPERYSKMKSNGGLFDPSPVGKHEGGHAMTVIGFDDNKFGGAFEVMNSWGNAYGEEGFIWVKYLDFLSYASELAVIEAAELNIGNCRIGNCGNGYGFYKLPGGSVYEGWFSDGNYDGFGVYSWADGTIYAGTWQNGKRNGKGLMFYRDKVAGCVYADDELLDTEVIGFAQKESPPQLKYIEKLLEKNNIKPITKITPQEAEMIQSKSLELK